MARPNKYQTEYCEKLIEHCKAGYDISSFGATIGIARSTVYKWIDKYPEFKQAHETGISHLKMIVTDTLFRFARGEMPRNASVIAAIYLAKVYGVRDDIKQDEDAETKKDKNNITVSYNLKELIETEQKEEVIEAEVIAKETK